MEQGVSLEQIKLLISFNMTQDEKKKLCQYIMQLPQSELISLARQVMELEDESHIQEILALLVKIRPSSLSELQKEWIDKEQFYPGTLYRKANAEVRTLLLQRMEEASSLDSLTVNHLLLSLAWVGDEEVQRQFSLWRQNPPSWADKLCIPPEEYSYEANWKLDENGKRQDLVYEEHIYTAALAAQKNIWLEERCQCCGWKLAVLFDLDLSNPKLHFLGMQGKYLRIATCIQCTCYSTIYTEVDGDGNVRWSFYNEKPEYCYHQPDGNYEDFGVTCFDVGPKQEAWEELYFEEKSKIGGYPVWINDAYFPNCPRCQEKMPFIAQHYEEGQEGLIYVYLCSSCEVVATHYDQT
ncbi:DUF1963 domain-containing protein [Polycladomyces abyssicola]|uniref:DUF1963 domain-containing protein n=1 Tax=Polycladomyces abyssicola TaxID=1125966 RepID=A0A8D5UFX3_9BACL|nr:DUF1963 domain-containing protein [Polycladomyces abyssicola]BCU82811.1 DUF1963 domain-containing protein [Polycladomyces abyssicola]